MWQETVETYVTQLFKYDFLTDIQKRMLHIEEPKTIINMNESVINMDIAYKNERQEQNKGSNIDENIEMIRNNFILI